MLLCSVVCVTECNSCGPGVNPFIFKKQMGHARLEINYGQISDLKTIGQKLDNYYNEYQPEVECVPCFVVSLSQDSFHDQFWDTSAYWDEPHVEEVELLKVGWGFLKSKKGSGY